MRVHGSSGRACKPQGGLQLSCSRFLSFLRGVVDSEILEL